jgi:hypothetical protein
MTDIQVNEAFVSEWEPKYDDTECDEPEYQRLLRVVAGDMNTLGTLSEETFLAIWRWKKAIRVIGKVKLDQYESLYAPAFRRAARERPDRQLALLIGSDNKLPGIEAPSGSTILHFIHPEVMPIIDVRTVEVLFAAGLVPTKHRDLKRYETFRRAIDHIRNRCSGWSLREIDRALFAYHKQVLAKRKEEATPLVLNEG